LNHQQKKGMIPPPQMAMMQRPPMQMQPQIGSPAIKMQQPVGEKHPTTTVFVGNIAERAPDTLIRQMLQVLRFLNAFFDTNRIE
jgi:hypothetical protein